MFRELVEYFFTPATKLARKYGFLNQSIALKHRFDRCRKIWEPHLLNTQQLFLEIARTLPKKDKVIVMGSAHLHEIPLHLLLQEFQKVVLVDIIHPLKHHSAAKANSRIELITQDISGVLADLEKCKTVADLEQLFEKQTESPFYFEADLIVSGNLISQLALLPMDYISHQIKRSLTLEEKDRFCTWAAEKHLSALQKCSGKILVYADREVIYRGRNDEIMYQGQYPIDFKDFSFIKEWTWTLAPLGEASKDYALEMTVKAYQS